MLTKQIWKLIILCVCSTVFAASFAAEFDNKKKETEKFVTSAVDYIKAHGKDAALKEFNNPHGMFARKDDYIFSIDYQGVFLANANSPQLVGNNLYDLKDIHGKYINHELIEKAKNGGGWVSYYWKEPTTNKVKCKISYVAPVDNYLVGSGFYVDDKNCK